MKSKELISTRFTIPAKYERKGKAKVYEFRKKRHGKYYEQKRVEVVYIIEGDIINNCYCLCILWKMVGGKMNILYNDKTDLLYLRLDDRKQDVVNTRVSENIVLDVGKDNKIVGIEILDASRHMNLERLLPVNYEPAKSAG